MADNNQDFMLTDDMLLDNIEDMPSFAAWPSGMYKVIMNDGIFAEEINEKPAFKTNLTLLEVLGMADDVTNDEAPKVGSELGMMFMRTNKFGAASYKLFANPIGKKLGVATVAEVNEQSKGIELTILLNRVQDKKDKSKFYNRAVEVIVN